MKINRYIVGLLLLLTAGPALSAEEVQDNISLVGSDIKIENRSVELSSSLLTVSIDLNLSDLKLKSSRRIILTPMVKGEGEKEVCMPQILINGRRQEIEYKRRSGRYDKEVVSVKRMNGKEQTVHYAALLPAESWMENCDILLYEDLCGCGDLLENGIIPVWSLRAPAETIERPAPKPKTYELKGSAYIDFPVDQTTLYPDFHNNPAELEKIISTIEKVREDRNVSIKKIELCGFASPESSYAHNEYLASNRVQTIKDYVCALLNISEELISVSYVVENWEGLRRYVEGSELKHKADILSLIDADMDPDEKEWEIKTKYARDYKYMLAEYYPWLRRCDYTITYVVSSFVEEEEEDF